MNRRHFVEFLQHGKFGEVHSISVDERMIEKVEVEKSIGFGPANYRIWLSGVQSETATSPAAPVTQVNGVENIGNNSYDSSNKINSCNEIDGYGMVFSSFEQLKNSSTPRQVAANVAQAAAFGCSVRFACVITLTVNKYGNTNFGFTIDGMQFEAARSRWILEYLRNHTPNCSS